MTSFLCCLRKKKASMMFKKHRKPVIQSVIAMTCLGLTGCPKGPALARLSNELITTEAINWYLHQEKKLIGTPIGNYLIRCGSGEG